MTTHYATHCPLCGREAEEEAEPYQESIECPEHGTLHVEVWESE